LSASAELLVLPARRISVNLYVRHGQRAGLCPPRTQ